MPDRRCVSRLTGAHHGDHVGRAPVRDAELTRLSHTEHLPTPGLVLVSRKNGRRYSLSPPGGDQR